MDQSIVVKGNLPKGGEVYAARHIKVKSSSSETVAETILKTNETGII